VTNYRTPSRHELALGGTAWHLWRDVCLRSAGFPARRVIALCDIDLAGAADTYNRSAGVSQQAFAAAYRAASGRLSGAVAEIANDPLFREAVLWQNPPLVTRLLDKVCAQAPRISAARKRELVVGSYLQRYCLKNETIGFFGPVGWASVTADRDELVVAPGTRLLAKRTTYFEVWAIDQVARVIAERGDVSGRLRPRRDPAVQLAGNRLLRPRHKPVVLSAGQLRMLICCDGQRTVSELLAGPEPDAVALLAELTDLGAVSIDLVVPVQARPEQWLRQEIRGVGAAALRPLDEVVAARDAVSAAAGDPDRLQRAMVALGQTFERVTGVSPTRRPGDIYAGRTLVYEDAVRDVDVRLGQGVTGALARPLGLVLDSARWLVAEITERYRRLFLELFDRECQRLGSDSVPLPLLMAMATADVVPPSGATLTDIAASTLEEFQERWRDVLRLPVGAVARHAVGTAAIAGRAAGLFPARPAAWSLASQHSPDIMIVAASADALRRGEFLLVLGELHMATNTLESRCFVEQHPDPARLLEAAAADHGGRRFVALPPKDSPLVTSRLTPPTALLSPEYTYWTAGADAAATPPGPVLPAAGLFVTRGHDDLVVSCASSGAKFAFFEVIGDIMTGVVINAFRPVTPGPHRPRVIIDRLVLSREAWTFQVDEAPWVFVKDEAERYALARRWRAERQLPERVFYKVPVEKKPIAADFRSLVLVNLLAKNVRRSKDARFSSFSVTEMLPDLDGLWLADAAGERYTCELRMVASDQGADAGGARGVRPG
jgi:Lantibiotic dehydratase, N terminus